jgi:Protein of unknown function (DUF732)
VRRAAVPTLLVLSAVLPISACSERNDMLAGMGLPATETAPVGADDRAGDLAPPHTGGEPNRLTVTPQQRDYLDALAAAGVHPTSDLKALSIGSAVCQAHAAKQSGQAMWDSIMPLVRSDMRATQVNVVSSRMGEVNAATADYIRIATERLC